MPTRRPSSDLSIRFVSTLNEMYAGPAWHGPSLAGALRGVTARDAVRRPAPKRHNIAELVVHCAYWKYTVRRRITGDTRGSFALRGSNFFGRDRHTAASWRADRALLAREHALLLRAVRQVDPARAFAPLPKSRWSIYETIRGIAAHDAYHAGQVQLLKRLIKTP